MSLPSITFKYLLGWTVLAAMWVGGSMPSEAQVSGDLRVATYGGSFMEGQKIFLGKPFETLTGAHVLWTVGTGEVFASKLIVAAGKSPPYDIVMLDDPWYSMVRVRGLIEKLSASRVPYLDDVLSVYRMPDDMGACVAGVINGIAYNKDKFKQIGMAAPTRWQDLADPKLSGHVGTQTLAASAPMFMLAGYAIGLGDGPTNWDRAIGEVAKIKFHSFSSSAGDLMAKMEAGDVWAAPMADGRATALTQTGAPIGFALPDNGNGTKGGVSCGTMSIPKGSPNMAAAERFMAFALSPGAQLMQATSPSPFGPVTGDLDKVLQKFPEIGHQISWGAAVKNGLRLSWGRSEVEKFPQYVEAWNRQIQK